MEQISHDEVKFEEIEWMLIIIVVLLEFYVLIHQPRMNYVIIKVLEFYILDFYEHTETHLCIGCVTV